MALAAPLAGCDGVSSIGPTSCDRSAAANEPILYTEGTVEGGIYMTSAWDGELLDFPGGRRYRLDHQLGVVPRFFQAYLSFNQFGVRDRIGTLAAAAGNQVEVDEVTDTSIVVINGSCVDYWLLVVAGAGDVAPDGAGGAGGD
jgi:hypothetical protein